MHSRKRHLTYAFGIFVMGAALVLISSVGAQATDAIDDPVRQPHLKSWSNVIPNADRRFIVLADFNNQAVLDRETGLVWEKVQDANPYVWDSAKDHCVNKLVGGRLGWRLPSVVELLSLQDPSLVYPFVPQSIFTGSWYSIYWSATTVADYSLAWSVRFSGSRGGASVDIKTNHNYVLCVRGPMNADAY